MAESRQLTLSDDEATQALGARLASAFMASGATGLIIYLCGALGAGKTTLARGFLRALGHHGRVPSPTYTLIEPYDIGARRVYHIDLYRIRDPVELGDLGLGDLLNSSAIALVEWPDHGAGHLPAADFMVRLAIDDAGRKAQLDSQSDTGRRLLVEFGSDVGT